MGFPRSITLLALATSAVSGVIVGWVWRGPEGSAAGGRVLGGKQGLRVALRADTPTAAASLTAAQSALARGEFVAFLEALERVAAHDLPGLWASCSAKFPPTSDWHAALLDRWAEVDPEAARQFLMAADADESTRNTLLASLFTGWTTYRPFEAVAALSQFPDGGSDRAGLAHAVHTVLVAEHPEMFLCEADTLKAAFPKTYDYDYWAPEAAARLARRDPERAVAIVTTAAGLHRPSVRLGLVLGWATHDPAAAEAWVATWPQRDQDSGRMRIACALAFHDPEATGRLLSQITTYRHQIEPEGSSDGKLVRFTWPTGHQDPLRTILTPMLRDDPAEAMAWTRRHLPAQADYQIARRLSWDWPANLESAMNTLTRLDRSALAETAKAGGLAIPERALIDRLDELAARFPSDQRDVGRTVLLASAARANPEAAVPPLLELPATPERDRVLEKAFTRWTERAPEAATTWLGSLPAGETRDRLVWQSIENTATADPPAAWAWLMTTAETKQRTDCYDSVLAAWADTDPVAARAALESLQVEGKTREYLFEVVEEHSR